MIDPMDIRTLRERFGSGALDPANLLARVLERIEKYPDPAVWIARFNPAQLAEQFAAAMKRHRSGIPQPLLGIPFAVKDNIDVAGLPTTAACPAYSRTPRQSATVVQRLCDAGAIVIGKTNLDQFATGLVGTRSPYGVCRNPFNPQYISGGSSSGSAVAVATGMVSFALGTDTAGSGRVPAALNNIVGLKPTRGLLSTSGVVPACRSLDCVSIFALNCDDAETIFEIARAHDPADAYSRTTDDLPPRSAMPKRGFRFGVPAERDLRFFGDGEAEALYRAAIERLQDVGGERVEIDYGPFAQAAALLYAGPWVAERYLAVQELLDRDPEAMLPVIRSIIERGKTLSAGDAFKGQYELEACRQRAREQWRGMDLMLLPTAGTCYTIEQVLADPIALNTNLGYYTNFVNLLDLCAVAVPSGFASGGVPAGVSLIAPAGRDLELLEVADALHRSLQVGPGIARAPLPPAERRAAVVEDPKRVRLAVVGAHLTGMPLNHQLTDRGGTLIAATRTAPAYRLYALPNTKPPKPGLIRVEREGVSIELEVWDLPLAAFGAFVAAIPAPLGIGMIELEDGSHVQGFLCEAYAARGATDISSYGGWRSFIQTR